MIHGVTQPDAQPDLERFLFTRVAAAKYKEGYISTKKNHYFQRKYVEGISVDLSAPAWVLSEGIQGKVR